MLRIYYYRPRNNNRYNITIGKIIINGPIGAVAVETLLYRSIIEPSLPFYTFSGLAFPYSRHVYIERQLFIRERARACVHVVIARTRMTVGRRRVEKNCL